MASVKVVRVRFADTTVYYEHVFGLCDSLIELTSIIGFTIIVLDFLHKYEVR
jgi:hypothetical protein